MSHLLKLSLHFLLISTIHTLRNLHTRRKKQNVSYKQYVKFCHQTAYSIKN